MAVAAALVLGFGWPRPAMAETFTTECPAVHPEKPDKKYISAQILHTAQGRWAAGDDEMILENGDEHWIERHPKKDWWFHRAFLACVYGDRGVRECALAMRLSIPGVLREYHVIYRHGPTGSANEIVSVRAWAISADDPLSEAPPGKLIPPQ